MKAADFGMFTEEGNNKVSVIVNLALMFKWSWDDVVGALNDLSCYDGYGEAADTEVRENVYMAINAEEFILE